MKIVRIEDLKVGTIVSKDMFNESGNLMLSSGTVIDQNHINYFLSHGIENMLVDEEPEANEAISPAHGAYENLRVLYRSALDEAKKMHSTVFQGNQIDLDAICDIVSTGVEVTKTEENVLRILRSVSQGEDYLFSHPVNVSILASKMAIWLGYDPLLAALAGIFHDIGKAKVKSQLFYKTTPLEAGELDQIKEHAMFGYDVLKKAFSGIMDGTVRHKHITPQYAKEILRTTIEHHERETGTGYPFGLNSENISFYSKIISVADVFDAITSDRHYREGASPYVAFRIMQEEAFRGLNAQITQVFLDKIARYFVGNKVRLSDGRHGEVVYLNKNDPNHPLVKCGQEFVDLSTNYSITIDEVLE
ncbi:MAG: HD domain-containing protein [Bacillota bacterium]|nr:HD domain-containing protein [Bacillota bacterium]